MSKQKLPRSEIIRLSYSIASSLLTVADSTVTEMCVTDEGLSDEDAERVRKHLATIAEMLARKSSDFRR